MNDYYNILGLKYKFTAFKLLNKYFEKSKLALATDNKEEFIKIRMGFEVLRDYKATDDYNRIHRKYILNEDLNFPSVREQQMVNTFQAREQIGSEIAKQVIAKEETFMTHKFKFILNFILRDLYRIQYSGLLYIIMGSAVMIKFHNPINVLGGGFIILVGLFMFRVHMIRDTMLN